jgi:hypothetical protein
MAIKTFTTGEVLTAADTNTYLANSGLVFVKSQTIGTTVSSVTVSSAFSTDYDQYVITVAGGTATTSNLIQMTLGATVTGYYEGRPGITIPGAAFAGNLTNNGAQFYIGQYTTTGKSMHTLLINPFLSTETRHFSQGYNTSTTAVAYSAGFIDNTTSYTAFTIAPLAGTWTGGTITVYGHRKG